MYFVRLGSTVCTIMIAHESMPNLYSSSFSGYLLGQRFKTWSGSLVIEVPVLPSPPVHLAFSICKDLLGQICMRPTSQVCTVIGWANDFGLFSQLDSVEHIIGASILFGTPTFVPAHRGGSAPARHSRCYTTMLERPARAVHSDK